MPSLVRPLSPCLPISERGAGGGGEEGLRGEKGAGTFPSLCRGARAWETELGEACQTLRKIPWCAVNTPELRPAPRPPHLTPHSKGVGERWGSLLWRKNGSPLSHFLTGGL